MQVLKIPSKDLNNIITVFLKEAGLFIAAIFLLFIDGVYFNEHIFESQSMLNILMILAFFAMIYRANPRVRELMIIGAILGFIGEHFFSKVLGNVYLQIRKRAIIRTFWSWGFVRKDI